MQTVRNAFVPEVVKANGHARMPVLGLIAVSAHQVIPPRKIEAEIAIRLLRVNRMMYAMHVRSDDEPTQDAVEPERHAHVAVIEH